MKTKHEYSRYKLRVIDNDKEWDLMSCQSAETADRNISAVTQIGFTVTLLGWNVERLCWVPISTHRAGSRPRGKRVGWHKESFSVVSGNEKPVYQRDYRPEPPMGYFFKSFKPESA